MTLKFTTTALATSLASSAAYADSVDGWDRGFGHMAWGGGFGMFGGLIADFLGRYPRPYRDGGALVYQWSPRWDPIDGCDGHPQIPFCQWGNRRRRIPQTQSCTRRLNLPDSSHPLGVGATQPRLIDRTAT